MLEINVTVHIPGLPEAINNLADAVKGYVNTIPAPVAVNETTVLEKTETAAPVTAPVEKAPANAATENAPVAVQTEAAPVAVAPPAEVKAAYTIEQLSVAGAALCEQGKMPQLIALLGKYGVQAVTQLNTAPENLNAFAAELKALGANL